MTQKKYNNQISKLESKVEKSEVQLEKSNSNSFKFESKLQINSGIRHVSFDEMVWLLKSSLSVFNEYNNEVKELLSHLATCSKCQSEYTKLLLVLDVFEKIKSSNRLIIKLLLSKNNIPSRLISDVERWSKNEFSFHQPFYFSMKNGEKIEFVQYLARMFDTNNVQVEKTFLEIEHESEKFDISIKETGLEVLRYKPKLPLLISIYKLPNNENDSLDILDIESIKDKLSFSYSKFSESNIYLFLIEKREI